MDNNSFRAHWISTWKQWFSEGTSDKGSFHSALMKAISLADGGNLSALEKSFPVIVETYKSVRDGEA